MPTVDYSKISRLLIRGHHTDVFTQSVSRAGSGRIRGRVRGRGRARGRRGRGGRARYRGVGGRNNHSPSWRSTVDRLMSSFEKGGVRVSLLKSGNAEFLRTQPPGFK